MKKVEFNMLGKIKLKRLLIIIAIFMIMPKLSLASKVNTKDNLIDGINKINYQTSLLKSNRVLKYKKLSKDLEEFREKGSSKIPSKNMFYILNTNEFEAFEYENAIKNTGLSGLGEDFKKAEDEYGVNAILLMAMAKHETGNGTSELFLNKNNLFGFNAYDYDPYNQAKDFDTPAESIMTVANHLKENYLSPDGPYYNGVSTDGIGISYATDPDWSRKVNWMMMEVAENMINAFNEETGN